MRSACVSLMFVLGCGGGAAAGDGGQAAPDGGAPAAIDASGPGPDAAPCVDEAPAPGAPLAAIGSCGRLVYGLYANRDQDHADNRLPDFSYAGYRRGGVAIPDVPVVETVSPGDGDDRARIQAAIDAVSARAPDANGFRGAVLLTAGTYEAGAAIRIETSGVVLRGEGQGADGTIVVATAAQQVALVELSGAGAPATIGGGAARIADDYVPVGATRFTVDDASGFAEGDRVAVRRTPNDQWIGDLGMTPYGWTPDAYDVAHERTIVAVDLDANAITIDIPIVDPIAAEHGGGQVERLDEGERIADVGVEDLRLDSTYTGPEDEAHGWVGVRITHVEDGWVRRVTALHFGGNAVSVRGSSRFITVEDSAMLDPTSQITGGRRYPFNVDGGVGVLFQRCYARNGRHNFVTGSRVTGPHVWLDCLAEDNHADDGPHHRWSTGLLFDNTRSSRLWVQNRQESGTGHGWAGAQVMFWNDDVTDTFISDAPQAAMNWVVGLTGDERDGVWAPEEPPGIRESLGTPVEPRSLYLQQLADRLGDEAVERVTTQAQRDGRIWDDLAAWAGEGTP